MTLLPLILSGAAALVLHLAMMLAAPPVGTALVEAGASLATARPRRVTRADIAALLLGPWHRLAFLMRKEPVRAGNASRLAVLAPPLSVAATLAAAALVPSFGIGMLTAPFADLPTILALLALARLLLLLGGLDAGIALPGLAALTASVRVFLAVPGCALAVAALWFACGSTSLETILTGLRGLSPDAVSTTTLLAAVGLGAAALATGGDAAALSSELSGPDLALFQYQAALQRLVWIDLVTALLLPASLTVALSNPLHWLLALLLWALRAGIACLVLGGLGGTVAAPASRRRLAGLSVLLGLLAPLLLARDGLG